MSSTEPVQRQRSARGEGDRLRVELLDAAAELLAEYGNVDGVSLRAVARRAGVSATAVYRHFDDHEQLIRASVEHCWRNFLAMLETAQTEGEDVFDAFERAGFGYATFATEHPGQYRVMFSNRIDIDGVDTSIGDATFQILVDQTSGMLDALGDRRDPVFVAVQVHTWIHGIVDLVGSHPDTEWPPIVDQLDGLRTALGLVRPD